MLMVAVPVIGLVVGYLLMARNVPATIDGTPLTIRTHALTVGGALRSAGFAVDEGDAVFPAAGTWLSKADEIRLDRARLVRVYDTTQKQPFELSTSALTAAEVFKQAGLTLGSQDNLTLNGLPVEPNEKLPFGREVTLNYRPAVQVRLNVDGSETTITSSAVTLGEALWQAGFRLREGDRVTPGMDTALTENLAVEIHTARPLSISVDGTILEVYSAAPTVAAALAENGVTLQDIDTSQPGAGEPLPEDGVIKVTRVTEEIHAEQRVIPFETEALTDDTMFVNETNITQAGQNGLAATLVKVRYEDGREVSRQTQNEVILYPPVAQVEYRGTKMLDNYIDTPEGALQYYLVIDAVATSFSPCRQGIEGYCSNGTASGRTIQKGVVAFKRNWFNLFRDTRVYVPGYGIGVVGDTGSYPYSDSWIDLGYSDADYVPWGAVKVKIYFLSPPPSGFTGVLP